MEQLCLLMMFMEIISLEIIVGHKERRDGDINHVTVTESRFLYRLLKMDGGCGALLCLSDNQQKTNLFFTPLGSSTQRSFVSQVIFLLVFFLLQVVWSAEKKASSKAHP